LQKKGQLSFDYIAGFAIFIGSVIYILTSLINIIPIHYQTIESNNMRQVAWSQSDKLINELEINNNELNETTINNFLNYYINQGEKMDYYSKIEFNIWPIIIFDNNLNKNTLIFDKKTNPTKITFYINLNETSNKNFINTSIDSTPKYEKNTITINSKTYQIKKIDQFGKYAILEYKPRGIEINILNINKYTIRRYSTYDGFMSEILLEFILK
jgi:hypothetical protein